MSIVLLPSVPATIAVHKTTSDFAYSARQVQEPVIQDMSNCSNINMRFCQQPRVNGDRTAKHTAPQRSAPVNCSPRRSPTLIQRGRTYTRQR
ncbi:hypothetical protein KCU62_g386, partial [Aureobasidium sp. EXF-3399]